LAIALVLIPVIAAGVAPAEAETPVTGPITQDTTWTAEGGPYVLSGIVTVTREATLTIQAGTVVQGSPDSLLSVEGALSAAGTEEDPIIFTSTSEEQRWSGIRFSAPAGNADPPPGESAISDAQILNADVGVELSHHHARITDSYFEHNSTAVLFDNPDGDVEVRSNILLNNGVALAGKTRLAVYVSANDLWNNGSNLLMSPQDIYDCGPDDGLWDVRGNDILLGPVNMRSGYGDSPGETYTYRPYDVRATIGADSSGSRVIATDNWWGTNDGDEIGPRVVNHSCCPRSPGSVIQWEPFSEGPHTTWEPDGEVLVAYSDTFHGDPRYVVNIEAPDHGECFSPGTARRLVGRIHGALGRPVPPKFALRRMIGDRCSWWSPRHDRFLPGACAEKTGFVPPSKKKDGAFSATVRFGPPLPPGRYAAFLTGKGDAFYAAGRSKIQFRVLPAR